MDEDDDDLYGSEAVGVTHAAEQRESKGIKNEQPEREGDLEVEDDEGEAIEEDSDSVSR